jgi:hypothetical protein
MLVRPPPRPDAARRARRREQQRRRRARERVVELHAAAIDWLCPISDGSMTHMPSDGPDLLYSARFLGLGVQRDEAAPVHYAPRGAEAA